MRKKITVFLLSGVSFSVVAAAPDPMGGGDALRAKSAVVAEQPTAPQIPRESVDQATISNLKNEIELLKAKAEAEKLKADIRKNESASLPLLPEPNAPIMQVGGGPQMPVRPSSPFGADKMDAMIYGGAGGPGAGGEPYVVSIYGIDGKLSARISVNNHVSVVDKGDNVGIDGGEYTVSSISESEVVLKSGKKTMTLRAN